MKFLHAADLHIDSPFKGLCFDDASAVDRLRLATRTAFQNVLQLAIDEAVDFVIIAGDLFDGAWSDMRTGLWTAEQFRRLREQRIRVYLIRGNHDARSVVAPAISWPRDVVHEFPVDRPTTVIDERTGAAVHGQSFADRKAMEDLAKRFPAAISDAYNIGILHTSLAGDPEHDTYAPTSPEVLTSLGYDYWALGHIHHKRVVQESPLIVYSGNTQGRHIKEAGAKGCYLVSVDSAGQTTIDFRATDVVRWQPLLLSLQNQDDEADLLDRLPSAFDRLLAEGDGRPVVARIDIAGSCRVHQHLTNAQSRSRILAEIRNRASDCGDLWIERIDCRTRPAIDIDELREGCDLIGHLLRSSAALRTDDAQLLQLAEHLQPMLAKVGDVLEDDDLRLGGAALVRRYLDQAENLLLSELLGGEA